MDKDDRPERKVRFLPKGSKRKTNRGTTSRSGAAGDSSAKAAETQEIPHRYNEQLGTGGPNVENTFCCSPSKLKNQGYRVPWDYNSNYPITLPSRQPGSGDPELHDKVEFADDLEEYDENSINTALELGLLEVSEKKKLFVLQLPSILPFLKQPPSAKGKANMGASLNGCEIKDLPRGLVGKMLVYKSGKAKLSLGNTLLDVNPGVEVSCLQHAVAINAKENHYCFLGDIHKNKIVVTPDIDSFVEDAHAALRGRN